MVIPQLLRLQGAHNTWINRCLFAVCATMSDEERKRDLGAFFHSIHGTFNHLLLGDRLWLGRLTAQAFPVTTLAEELYADFDELRREREKTDAEIEAFIGQLEEADLDAVIEYSSVATGRTHRYPLGVVLTHLFHHQTHHRGQATVLIGQLGYDFGETDLIGMPDLDLSVR